jgi:hypothetical protein
MQAAVIAWCRSRKDGRRYAIHIPNEGKRSPRLGAQLKKEGMLPGVSDIFIPMARGGWYGLWFELKSRGKKPTGEQYDFLAAMAAQGYATGWTDDLDTAISEINRYADGRWLRPDWVHYESPARVSA